MFSDVEVIHWRYERGCTGLRPMVCVACTTWELRVAGVAFFGGTGGGSSGLSSCGAAIGGT